MERRRRAESEKTVEEYIEVETAAETLEKSVSFHVVKEMVSFVLYMHQQIPAIFQDISHEFDAMQSERKDLELVITEEVKASSRRKQIGRMREVKQGIKRLEKLMTSVSNLQTALQLMLDEIHCVHRVVLVLGSSPIHPLHVYEMVFSHGGAIGDSTKDYAKNKTADALSRKVIRALISKGAGSVTYAGPTKLFLMVKAPATFNLPSHFLPKRGYKYNKKIVPLRLCIKCKARDQIMDASMHAVPSSNTASSAGTSDDLIWFQCRHTIKGLTLRAPSAEE